MPLQETWPPQMERKPSLQNQNNDGENGFIDIDTLIVKSRSKYDKTRR